MIASVGFRHFKALRNTRLALAPFNLVIGPNGSGKTSLIEALLRLRTLSRLPLAPSSGARAERRESQVEFRFSAPHEGITVRVECTADLVCDGLRIYPPEAPGWPALCEKLSTVRGYVLDHVALGAPSPRGDGEELVGNGANLAAVLATMRERDPDAFTGLTAELLRILPEFRSLELVEHSNGTVEFGLRLAEDGVVPAGELSQGMLYLVAVLALAFDPTPPRVLCVEEIDRGVHPRMLREVRDALYRLCFPKSFGLEREPVQIVTTTHSPYFIDLFRDHPEEIVISQKQGRAARFERLADRPDLPELLREGALGDIWFSGILGGVPEQE